MSQAGTIGGGGGGGGGGANTFATQNGTATPLSNVIIINAVDLTDLQLLSLTSTPSPSNISAYGGAAATGASNKVDIVLPNHFHGTVTTTDAAFHVLASCPMVANACYDFTVNFAAVDQTNNTGMGADYHLGIKTTTGGPFLLPDDVFNIRQDATFPGTITFFISLTQIIFSVSGQGTDTIKWICGGTFNQAGP